MSQKNNITELGEMYPDKVNFYTKLKDDRENYMDSLKRVYNNILQLNFSIVCLKLRLGTVLENSSRMELMLSYDVADLQEDNEAHVVVNE